jgi:hypothetical protein
MALEVAEIRRQVDRVAGAASRTDRATPPPSGRSLYPLFFSPTDEKGIYERLARAEKTSLGKPGCADTHSVPDDGQLHAAAIAAAQDRDASPLAEVDTPLGDRISAVQPEFLRRAPVHARRIGKRHLGALPKRVLARIKALRASAGAESVADH